MESPNYQDLIISCFNEYQGDNIEVLDRLYDEQVVFEDPLVKVSGLPALKRYYQQAYGAVRSIEFHFKEIHQAGLTFVCQWDMTLKATPLNFGKAYSVRGASVITFSSQSNKVIRHHDYVDIGEMVYEQIPVLGQLVKTIKNRLH